MGEDEATANDRLSYKKLCFSTNGIGIGIVN
jgi:hypothetical protein